MASRQFKQQQFTQVLDAVRLPFTIIPNGTNPPVMGEGDPNASYFTPARTGVGAYTLRTLDTYYAVITMNMQLQQGTPAGGSIEIHSVVQNADGTITIAFGAFSAGAAVELNTSSGDAIYGEIVFRNTVERP